MEALISRLISMGLFKYLGVGAIGLFIWYTGPYISFMRPVSHRLIAIAVVVVLYGGYIGIRALMQRRKGARLARELEENAEESADTSAQRSSEEIAVLREKFDQALSVLKKAGKSGKGSTSLYALPWYMVIGPPGAGKTTLLVNSGLKFPLAEKMGLSKLQGVGGTRFCDWWFTEDAVVVDTAGRYTTQDSDEDVDNAAWMGFLRLLRRNRKRRPINGIVVAVAIDELTRQTEVDRERTAAAISLRIQELYSELGVRFPIYVMFTKCDLLSGFMEFFGDLDRNQRDQVWGTTFALDDDAVAKLPGELALLQEQLEGRLVQRLQQERDPARRNLIYNFPSLFNAAQPLVSEFIERVFKPSRYTMTPMLRGVYFTSGTQEGTPFNRLISQLARSFNLSHDNVYAGPQQGKSFFIRNLLSSVIFGESGLAGANIKAERFYRYASLAGIASIAVVPLILFIFWGVSYAKNSQKMEVLAEQYTRLSDDMQDVSELDASIAPILPILDETRNLSFGYREVNEDQVPLGAQFGLYQGKSLARSETIPAYRNALENAFLSRILLGIERELRENLSDPGRTKAALKAYSMLHYPDEMDPEYVKSWLTKGWQRNFENSSYRRYGPSVEQHLDALLDLRPFAAPYEVDVNLVQHALAVIEQTPRHVLVYSTVKDELLGQHDDFSLHSHGGPDAPMALRRQSGRKFTEGVPFLFSPDGYREFNTTLARVVEEEEDDTWLKSLSDESVEGADKQQLIDQVSNLYVEDFIRNWTEFLEDIRIQPYTSTDEAREILRTITSDESPLALLLQGAVEWTDLDLGLPEGEAAASIVNQLPGDPARIGIAFEDLHEFVNGTGDEPSQLTELQRDIRELMVLMSKISNKGGIDFVSAQEKLDIAANAEEIRLGAANAPGPMERMIEDIADQAAELLAGSQMRNLNGAWRGQVNQFCQQAIAGRYPFARSSEREVSMSEFTEFFGPGGRMDRFFEANLSNLVNRGRGRWTVRDSLAAGISISPAALEQMRKAEQIREAFFPTGSSTPQVAFTLTPERMDKQAASFTLHALGEQLSYQHDFQVPTRLNWPASDATFGVVQMQFKPTDPNLSSQSRTIRSEWSWFRLLDESNPRSGNSPEEYIVTFALPPHSIEYRLRADRARNPFNLALHTFRCVPNL